MFGFVQADLEALSPEEQARYRTAYCGLCRTLGERHGIWAKLSLTYDLTFLLLLLSSLYEEEETEGTCRCIAHPCRRKSYMTNSCVEYAADMTVALSYYKCLDDWNDGHALIPRGYAGLLAGKYRAVKERWPEQCQAIEMELDRLSEIERNKQSHPDEAANCFGMLMGALFLFRRDRWAPELCTLGYGLGRYIYFADAAVDLKRDRKRGNYNPLAFVSFTPEEIRTLLMATLGEASSAFESLPLVQDVNLLRNILYSGIWLKYNQGMQQKGEQAND